MLERAVHNQTQSRNSVYAEGVELEGNVNSRTIGKGKGKI